jgi:hypothetical protein
MGNRPEDLIRKVETEEDTYPTKRLINFIGGFNTDSFELINKLPDIHKIRTEIQGTKLHFKVIESNKTRLSGIK